MRAGVLLVFIACTPQAAREANDGPVGNVPGPSTDRPLAVPEPTVVPAAPSAVQASASTAGLAGAATPPRRPRAWGQELKGVIRQLPPGERPRLALTFDACGGPGGDGYDAELIELLRRERVPATLFLTARWIATHRDVAADLAAEPLFEIENHGAAHKPCSVDGRAAFGIAGTRSVDAAAREIVDGAQSIESLTGKRPRFFRPGTGYFDDVCVELVHGLGAKPLGFAVNGDGGTGYGRDQIQKTIVKAPDGAIVLMHMNHPRGATAEGVGAALPGLRERGVELVRLRDVLVAPGED